MNLVWRVSVLEKCGGEVVNCLLECVFPCTICKYQEVFILKFILHHPSKY